jgi:hypothetical protein
VSRPRFHRHPAVWRATGAKQELTRLRRLATPVATFEAGE